MKRSVVFALLLSAAAAAAWRFGVSRPPRPAASDRLSAAQEGPPPERDRQEGAPDAKERMVLVNFDGPTLPRNGDGQGYPSNYVSGGKEGGRATLSIEKADAVSGHSLRVRLSEGQLYAQFNPYNYAGRRDFPPVRGFARDYTRHPRQWQFNTYNRLRFWIKAPTSLPGHRTDGRGNANVGTYVKRVANPDRRSDEEGGAHYYHGLNIPALGEWSQVVLNTHPDHRRGESGSLDPGVQVHPTGEAKYNYFDTLTRFYIQYEQEARAYPADFLLDEVEFFRQPHAENDERAYALTATYRAADGRLILTWARDKADEKTSHEVRYAFADIHRVGWAAATPAPRGVIRPLHDGAYNHMVYDTTQLPLAGRPAVYLAVKPVNADRFSQIVVPLPKAGAAK